jgi:hypothetical protein
LVCLLCAPPVSIATRLKRALKSRGHPLIIARRPSLEYGARETLVVIINFNRYFILGGNVNQVTVCTVCQRGHFRCNTTTLFGQLLTNKKIGIYSK